MLQIRKMEPSDLASATEIWNEVVREGKAFPQTEPLTATEADAFFAAQSRTAVAEADGQVLGMYILHPNNVGRCGHIANASYAVASSARGRHVGEALVRDSLAQAKTLGFRVMQFNAVVASNTRAIALYEKIGFTRLGVIPGGFRYADGSFVDIYPFIYAL